MPTKSHISYSRTSSEPKEAYFTTIETRIALRGEMILRSRSLLFSNSLWNDPLAFNVPRHLWKQIELRILLVHRTTMLKKKEPKLQSLLHKEELFQFREKSSNFYRLIKICYDAFTSLC
jgi:hypothetical protein